MWSKNWTVFWEAACSLIARMQQTKMSHRSLLVKSENTCDLYYPQNVKQQAQLSACDRWTDTRPQSVYLCNDIVITSHPQEGCDALWLVCL